MEERDQSASGQVTSCSDPTQNQTPVVGLTFDDVFFDGLLSYMFEYIYPVRTHRQGRSLGAARVNKRWRSLFAHPLVVYLRGGFTKSLLTYPPTYYYMTDNLWWGRIVQYDAMTKQIESVTDDPDQEQFILDNMLLHFFKLDIQCKNKKIMDVILDVKEILGKTTTEIFYSPVFLKAVEKHWTFNCAFWARRAFRIRSNWIKEQCTIQGIEFCKAIVRKNYTNMSFIPKELQTVELCALAMAQSPRSVSYVRRDLLTQDMCDRLITLYPVTAINYLPKELVTKELCLSVVKSSLGKFSASYVGEFISEQWRRDPDVIQALLDVYPKNIERVPAELRTEEFCKQVVSAQGDLLIFVPTHIRTQEICNIAFENSVFALPYMLNEMKTNELYQTAFQRDSSVITHIPADACNEDMYKTALQKDGLLIRVVPVKSMTEELCLIAVKQNVKSIMQIPREIQTEAICNLVAAHSKFSDYLTYLAKELRTYEICKIAVTKGGKALRDVPVELITPELCRIAVESCHSAITFTPEAFKTDELCMLSFNKGHPVRIVPKHLRTYEVYLQAVKRDYANFEYVPNEMRTEELRRASLSGLRVDVFHEQRRLRNTD